MQIVNENDTFWTFKTSVEFPGSPAKWGPYRVGRIYTDEREDVYPALPGSSVVIRDSGTGPYKGKSYNIKEKMLKQMKLLIMFAVPETKVEYHLGFDFGMHLIRFFFVQCMNQRS